MENRDTIPAAESPEEAALLCVQRGEIGLREARLAVARFRARHGFSWISLIAEGAEEFRRQEVA